MKRKIWGGIWLFVIGLMLFVSIKKYFDNKPVDKIIISDKTL